MTMLRKASVSPRRGLFNVLSWIIVGAGIAFLAAPAQAQQTGNISGQVTDAAGTGVADVEVEASSDVLPQAATAVAPAAAPARARPPATHQSTH